MFWSGFSHVFPHILLAAMLVLCVVHLPYTGTSRTWLLCWVGVRRWSCKVHSGRVLKVQVFYNVYIPWKSTTIKKNGASFWMINPLQKSWWFGNQAVGNCGWTSRVYTLEVIILNLNWGVANKRVFICEQIMQTYCEQKSHLSYRKLSLKNTKRHL